MRVNVSDIDLNLKADTANNDNDHKPRERVSSTTEAERLDDIALAEAILEVEQELKKEKGSGIGRFFLVMAGAAIFSGIVLQYLDIIKLPLSW
jgi:hypothetical protein